MKATLTQTALDLAARAVCSIGDFQGGTVHCLRGRLWITAEGHAQDVWDLLDAGANPEAKDAVS